MTFWEWQLSADDPGGIIQSYILCVTVLAVLSRQTNSSLILHTLDLHLEICLMDPLPRLFSRITILLLKEICDTCKIWGLCILVSTRQLCIWGELTSPRSRDILRTRFKTSPSLALSIGAWFEESSKLAEALTLVLLFVLVIFIMQNWKMYLNWKKPIQRRRHKTLITMHPRKEPTTSPDLQTSVIYHKRKKCLKREKPHQN